MLHTYTARTWKDAAAYIADTVPDGCTLAWGTGTIYSEQYTACRIPFSFGLPGYSLHRNTGNGELGPVVAEVYIDPVDGEKYL